uniref:acetyl-coenzyme A synthetase N-terminal domain-containing protein n=1 Tax=Rhodosalinus sp. TaxID=2047741 RepID=UPI00356B6169
MTTTHPPSAETVARAHVDAAAYERMYAESVSDPDGFWAREAGRLDWMRAPETIRNVSFDFGAVDIRWFEDGTLNVAANCIDRHLPARAGQTAILWEPDDPSEPARHITYAELHREVGRMANVLKNLGIGRGDRVVIYLPMIPEAA